jgi:hypothetical protein
MRGKPLWVTLVPIALLLLLLPTSAIAQTAAPTSQCPPGQALDFDGVCRPTGCCQSMTGSCSGQVTNDQCYRYYNGLAWTEGTSCSSIPACEIGCCRYPGNVCAQVTNLTCSMDMSSTGWTSGACPPPPECIPEPGTILLVIGGFAMAGRYLRRRVSR